VKPAINVLAGKGKWEKGGRKVNRFATRKRQLANSPARQVNMWALTAPDWFVFGKYSINN